MKNSRMTNPGLPPYDVPRPDTPKKESAADTAAPTALVSLDPSNVGTHPSGYDSFVGLQKIYQILGSQYIVDI